MSYCVTHSQFMYNYVYSRSHLQEGKTSYLPDTH